jgi:hypothetical protein
MKWVQSDIKTTFFCILIWLPSVLYAQHRLPIRMGDIRQAFDAGYGVQALPAVVAEMKALAERHSVVQFSLDPKLRDNVLVLQRAVEFLYPVRMDQSAKLVMAPADAVLPGCRPIEIGHWVALHECQ